MQAVTAVAAFGALVFTGISLQETQHQNAAQNDLTAQTQFTDRYTKAVDQLGQQGTDQLQIRLGGIYALERLARDSPRDQPTIIEVLSAFVRTTNPRPARREDRCSKPSDDTQAALTVLGRRDPTHDNNTPIDLRSTCLHYVNLTNAKLTKAKLTDADLFHANLTSAKLTNADLTFADLTQADLIDANLTNAALADADLTEADLTRANLTSSNLSESNLSDADLRSADLTRADMTGVNLSSANLDTASLSGARLTAADLRRAKLFKANLAEADMTSVNLAGANLTNAYLSGANLTAADLSKADLSGAIHDSMTLVGGVVTDAKTLGKWW